MMLLKEQWELYSSKEHFMRKKNTYRKEKVENHFNRDQFCLWNLKNPCITSRPHQLQVHEQTDAQFFIHGALQKNTLTRELKKKKLEQHSSVGPASEVEIFHDLRGETVTSIITEKTATAREKKTTTTHTHPHTHSESAGG